MVGEEAYCIDVLTQIAAVEKALDGVTLPPGPKAPAAIQTARLIGRPVSFFERCRRQFGETFSARVLRHRTDRLHLGSPFPEAPVRGRSPEHDRSRPQHRPRAGARTTLAPVARGRRASTPAQADAAALSRRTNAGLRGGDGRGDRAGVVLVADRITVPAPSSDAVDHSRGDPERRVRGRGRRAATGSAPQPGWHPGHHPVCAGDRDDGWPAAPPSRLPADHADARRDRSDPARRDRGAPRRLRSRLPR